LPFHQAQTMVLSVWSCQPEQIKHLVVHNVIITDCHNNNKKSSANAKGNAQQRCMCEGPV